MPFFISFILLAGALSAADSLAPLKGKVPQTVAELWAGYDPRKEALKSEVVREWEEDGNVIRYVRYFIGTFKGKPAWMAGFYAFPNLQKSAKARKVTGHFAHAWRRAAGEFAVGEVSCGAGILRRCR